MVIGLALLGLGSLPALAGLGGSVDSVRVDSVHMRAQLRGSTSAAGYSIEELQLPSGTLLKEYVSPAGKVFAVSWHGPTIPDLRQTLGSYFHQYAEASSVAVHNVRTRRHFEVKQSDLVVQSSGRMRDFYGRAYVPSLLPPNVTAADIQ